MLFFKKKKFISITETLNVYNEKKTCLKKQNSKMLF